MDVPLRRRRHRSHRHADTPLRHHHRPDRWRHRGGSGRGHRVPSPALRRLHGGGVWVVWVDASTSTRRARNDPPTPTRPQAHPISRTARNLSNTCPGPVCASYHVSEKYDWTFRPTSATTVIMGNILGDSNVTRISTLPRAGRPVHAHSYRGAKLCHFANQILEKPHSGTLPSNSHPFNRNQQQGHQQKYGGRSGQAPFLQGQYQIPNARILVAEINYSSELPDQEIRRITDINQASTATKYSINFIPPHPIWTTETAWHMVGHWFNHIPYLN